MYHLVATRMAENKAAPVSQVEQKEDRKKMVCTSVIAIVLRLASRPLDESLPTTLKVGFLKSRCKKIM